MGYLERMGMGRCPSLGCLERMGMGHCPALGCLEWVGMGHCQPLGLPIPQWEEGCLQMQALKQGLVKEGRGVRSALALQVGERTSVEAENPGHDFVPMIDSVKECLRQGVMDLAPANDAILSCELLDCRNRMHRDV